MKYLNKNYKNLKELKTHYKELVKQYHPDLNGGANVEIMQTINNEYEELVEIVKLKSDDKRDRNFSEDTKEFEKVIVELLKLKGLIIEIRGTWIWVYGNTYQNRENIKAIHKDFKYSKKSRKWYLPDKLGRKWKKYKGYRAKGDAYSRAKYGYKILKSDDEEPRKLL